MVNQWNKYRSKFLNKQIKRLRNDIKKNNKIYYLCKLIFNQLIYKDFYQI